MNLDDLGNEIHIGFTGTQKGMTTPQAEMVTTFLTGFVSDAKGYLHHGWCVGADEEADAIARRLGYSIIGHPPIVTAKMADLPEPLVMCDPKDYLTRNTDIAKAAKILLAAPNTYSEQPRSGTWSTVRRGRKFCWFVFVVYPDGSWTLDTTKHQ